MVRQSLLYSQSLQLSSSILWRTESNTKIIDLKFPTNKSPGVSLWSELYSCREWWLWWLHHWLLTSQPFAHCQLWSMRKSRPSSSSSISNCPCAESLLSLTKTWREWQVRVCRSLPSPPGGAAGLKPVQSPHLNWLRCSVPGCLVIIFQSISNP